MKSKMFSVQEVNQLIPVLEIKLAEIQKKKDEYTRKHDQLFMHELLSEAEGHLPSSAGGVENFEKDIHEMEAAILDLEKDVKQISSYGCILRNLSQGIVDFPGENRGSSIYFCWKKGEKEISFYHRRDQRFAERSSLSASV